MRELTVFSTLLVVLFAQSISYDSVFCSTFIGNYTSTAMWPKYQKMVENLNKDESLNSQQARVSRFINRNWKGLWGINNKYKVEQKTQYAKKQVAARWQMVEHLKELLAGLKPKLTNTEFEKIEKVLWDADESEKQNVRAYFYNWRENTVISMISPQARRREIVGFLMEWEERDDFITFENNQIYWNSQLGYVGCF